MNGGMQRCFHILHQLSKNFRVTAIINQDKEEFEKAFHVFPALRTVTIYSTKNRPKQLDVFSAFPVSVGNALRYRWYKRTVRGTTDSNLINYYPLLKEVLLTEKFDTVILENLDTLNAVDVIRRYNKKAVIIYDTHNVGTELAESEVKKGLMPEENMEAVKFAETHLFQTVNAIFTCSERELRTFQAMNQHPVAGSVIPNGVRLEEDYHDTGVQLDHPTHIIFCGSLGYGPNIEGLEWFYKSIWPGLNEVFPNLKLIVAGSGRLPSHLKMLENDISVICTGTVEDLKPWYNKAAVAIVPLFSGSGTRLKILEAMGMGVPVISTAKGAEGIEYSSNVDIVIGNDEISFLKSLKCLLENKDKRLTIQEGGRRLVESNYDWNIVGKKMEQYLAQLSASSHLV